MPLTTSEASQYAARTARWWTAEKPLELAEKMMDVAGHIYRALQPNRLGMATATRLYNNTPILGLTPRLYRHHTPTQKMNRLTYNLVKAVIDTYTALITKDRPKVSLETSGGDWSLQRKAKLVEKFLDGIFYEIDIQELAPLIVQDSALWGMGIVKLYLDTDGPSPRIRADRVMPLELLVDDQDAFYGKPQTMYHFKYHDRYQLMELYPDLAEQIQVASSSSFTDAGNYGTGQDIGTQLLDQVVVVEGWHLPSHEGAKDGRHTIAIGQCVLLDEEWTRDYFPFAILYRQKPVVGIWGMGLADELAPLQVEIGRCMQTIQRSQRLSVGHWLVEQNSEFNTNQLNDVVASVFRYTGVAPTYYTAPAAQPDFYTYLWQIVQKGFESVGISQMAAQSQKPPGLNSGKALLVFADTQSQRFEVCYREYQHWFMGMARQIIDLARDASAIDPKFKVKATGSRQMMKEVRWAEANLDDEEFNLKLYPTNALADDPAARLQQVQDLMNAGVIAPDDGKRLLDMPDLEALGSLQNSSYDNVMRAYDRIVDDGEYFGPEIYMNLPQSIQIMQQCYLKARLDDVPQDKLDMIERWMSEAKSQLDDLQKQQAAANPAAPPPGGPGAGPAGPGGPPGGPPSPEQQLENRTQIAIQRELARQNASSITGVQ
jgi:hypothetical protein